MLDFQRAKDLDVKCAMTSVTQTIVKIDIGIVLIARSFLQNI